MAGRLAGRGLPASGYQSEVKGGGYVIRSYRLDRTRPDWAVAWLVHNQSLRSNPMAESIGKEGKAIRVKPHVLLRTSVFRGDHEAEVGVAAEAHPSETVQALVERLLVSRRQYARHELRTGDVIEIRGFELPDEEEHGAE